ncbi:MAG: hypothetical protein PHN49_03460 [Candidatus Omnitrophica bacterium]|nr:hypothetical protein [Candidatus Omnitrophota bacterium]MDD5670677.1 hypothetical protein [Candidatus Omnitrophota bacterium]
MEKTRWPEFIAAKVKVQIGFENAEKAQLWALGLLCLGTLGFALNIISGYKNPVFVSASKVMFLLLFHPFMALGIFIPSLLQKGEKPFAKFIGIRDFTSLNLISVAIAFYSVVVMSLSYQVAVNSSDISASSFFVVVAWGNFLLTLFYLVCCALFYLSLAYFPLAIAKTLNLGNKLLYAFLGIHVALFFFLGFGYAEVIPIGSPQFFEQLFTMALFWIFITATLLFIGKILGESVGQALSALELEVVSGKLDRAEDILEHYKGTFISPRLTSWLNRLSHQTATRAHDIAQYAHDALSLVNRDKPSEIDLRQVDERYKKSESAYKKLEKEHQRFQTSIALIELLEVEREQVSRLQDQFSRECRNAKLELASIRKRIDEKLVALKNMAPQEIVPPPVEKAPLLR